jgi:TRAP-type C4-dicarboxylate transport system substrate-binding protein
MSFKFAAAIGLAGALLAGAAQAQEWNLPAGYPENNFQTKNLNWFAGEVAKATDGKLKLVVHPGGSLVKLPDI